MGFAFFLYKFGFHCCSMIQNFEKLNTFQPSIDNLITSKKNYKMKYLLSYFFLLLTVNVFSQNINVTPARINFNLEPGEFYETEVVVRNTAAKKQKISINLGDFEMDAEGESSFSDANTSKFSCAGWMSVSPSFLELNPNESKKVKVKIKVPTDGMTTRWAMLFVEPADEQVGIASADKSLSLGASVNTRIGIPVFQSPRKSGALKADIRNLKEIPNDSLRLFTTEIVNEGDKIIDGELFTVFSNIETGAEIEMPTQKMSVFPKNTRNFKFALPSKLPKGKYVLTVVLNYDENADQEGVRLNITVD